MRLTPALLALLVLALAAAPARAHAIKIDSFTLPDGRIRIEVFYSTDARPALGAEVVVRDSSGAEVARGTTDERGGFEFASKPGAVLEVEARHEGGHRAVCVVRAGALPAGPLPVGQRRAVPWGALAAGLFIIAGLALGARWLLRSRRAS
jgi:hypothetical protein